MEALETVWSAVAGPWTGWPQEECVDAGIDVGAARAFGRCEGATVASQSHITRFSTHLKENWRRAVGDVVLAHADVKIDDPGSWKGYFPDLETDLGGQLIETNE